MISLGKPGSKLLHSHEWLRETAHLFLHTGTMLKLTTVKQASSSASGESKGTIEKANLLLEELLQGSSTQLGP